jgi:sortase A
VASTVEVSDVTAVEAPGDERLEMSGAPDVGARPATVISAFPSRRPTRVSATLWILVAVTSLALWFIVYAFALSALQERGSQARLYARYRSELAAGTAPVGGIIKAGSPVALISAPTGGLRNATIVEGTTAAQLARGPGHLSDTPLPGQAGLSVVFGRSVTYGAPFGAITHMKVGDRVTVTTGQGVFNYRVLDVRYPRSPLPATLATGASRLTLVTAAGAGWRSGWAPEHTVYVDASLSNDQTAPAPPGLPTAVSKTSLPMQGDTGTLVELVFWLEGLVIVSAALAWSWSRWGRLQTWLAGLPLLLAVLWGATGAAALLLPNLY